MGIRRQFGVLGVLYILTFANPGKISGGAGHIYLEAEGSSGPHGMTGEFVLLPFAYIPGKDLVKMLDLLLSHYLILTSIM